MGNERTGMEEKEKHYLIYYKGANGNHGGHSVIYFVHAVDATHAMLRFLMNQHAVQEGRDGLLTENGTIYSHPLAYIETWYKFYGEWQLRQLPDWTRQQPVCEVFCGESEDGLAQVAEICRREFLKEFPRSRARTFVWYLKQGTLVTFFRGSKPARMEILKRYLWRWDGHTQHVEEWRGDYAQLSRDLEIELHYTTEPMPPRKGSEAEE
jgi:hypothetical protein